MPDMTTTEERSAWLASLKVGDIIQLVGWRGHNRYALQVHVMRITPKKIMVARIGFTTPQFHFYRFSGASNIDRLEPIKMQLIKTVNGVEIHLTDAGKFRAVVNGDEVLKPTLGAIEKVINGAPKMPTPIKVMFARGRGELGVCTVVKTRSRGYSDALITDTGQEISSYHVRDLLVYDDAMVEAADVIRVEFDEMSRRHSAEERALSDRFSAIIKDAVPFTADMLKPAD